MDNFDVFYCRFSEPKNMLLAPFNFEACFDILSRSKDVLCKYSESVTGPTIWYNSSTREVTWDEPAEWQQELAALWNRIWCCSIRTTGEIACVPYHCEVQEAGCFECDQSHCAQDQRTALLAASDPKQWQFQLARNPDPIGCLQWCLMLSTSGLLSQMSMLLTSSILSCRCQGQKMACSNRCEGHQRAKPGEYSNSSWVICGCSDSLASAIGLGASQWRGC